MKRQRYVYPTEEIPHKWAHATQMAARNPQGNLSFNGDVLRSYSTDIAQIYRHKARGTLVLLSEHRYSNTTAKQLHEAWLAVSHLPRMRVPYPCIGRYGAGMRTAKGAHALNVKFLADRAAAALKKAQRAMSVRSAQWEQSTAEQAIKDASTYLAFFGMRNKAPVFPTADWIAAAARAARIENPDPASADARERASARRKAATAARDEYRAEMRRSQQAARAAAEFYPMMAKRTDWRLHDAFDASQGGMWHDVCKPYMLRVEGDDIETSGGARIPLAAAPMVWAMVQRHLGRGWSRKADGLCTRKVGDYPLDRIEADGTLVVGCHTIPHSELRSMARALNLAGAA